MKRYRVECNSGCRYFRDLDRAMQYFQKCKEKHLDCSVWVVTYIFDDCGYLANAHQYLISSAYTSLLKN